MLTRIATRIKPAPVKATVTLFDATRKARVPAFGRGLLAYIPHHGRMPFTAADLDWLAAQGGAGPDDAEFDRMADAAANLDRYTCGWLAL